MTGVPYKRVVLTDKARRKAQRENATLLPIWRLQYHVYELEGDLYRHTGDEEAVYRLRVPGEADIVFKVQEPDEYQPCTAVVITQTHIKGELDTTHGWMRTEVVSA